MSKEDDERDNAGGEEEDSRTDNEQGEPEDDDQPKRKRSRKQSKSAEEDETEDKGRKSSDSNNDEHGEDSSSSIADEDDEEDEDGELPKVARKYKTRMKAADKRASSAEKERDQAREELEDTRVELAVRREIAEGERSFQDADLVLDLVREHVVVQDGEPTKVEEALDWLADRHPYLLSDDEDDDERVEPERSNGRSGPPLNKPKRTTSSKLDKETLRRKYSALRK